MSLQTLAQQEDRLFENATSPNGAFPLQYETMRHLDTQQRYRCFQKEGSNSQVISDMRELWNYTLNAFPTREFIVSHEGTSNERTSNENTSQRLTYFDVVTAATNLAHELQISFGATTRSVVALAGRNTPEWIVAFVAVNLLGATILPLNAWLTDADLGYCLDHSQASILLVDGERLAKTSFKARDRLKVACMNRKHHKILDANTPDLDDLERRGAARPGLERPQGAIDQDEPAMLMYTSGTTSKPKGVLLNQRAVMSAVNMLRLMEHIQHPDVNPAKRPQVVQLVPVPLFHVNGTHNMLLSGAAVGRRLVLMEKWTAERQPYLPEYAYSRPDP